MKVGFTKQLQQSDLYKELLEIKLQCCKYSLNREQSNNNYNKHLKNTNKAPIASYNTSRFTSSQANLQKSSCIVDIATQNNLIPIFMTITLKEIFHYLKGKENTKNKSYLYYELNEKFEFDSVQNSIKSGYKLLNKFHRTFYQEVKRANKNMYYISCFEPHKSLIPHLHILFFVEPDMVNRVNKIFDRKIELNNLGRSDFKVLDAKEDGNSAKLAASYINKYMFKNLSNRDDEFYSKMLDGYYKSFKIRPFRMSNLPMSLNIYKKIYHNLDRKYKNDLVEKLNGKKSLFRYIQDNITIDKTYLDKNLESLDINKSHKLSNLINKEFLVDIHIKKYRCFIDRQIKYKIIHFRVVHNINNEQTIIYDKENYKQSNLSKLEDIFEIDLIAS